MDGLWTGLGDRLAERFIVAVLTPAFVFWAGGLVAWAAPDRWRDVGHWIAHLSTPAAIAVAAGALVVVVASGAVVGRFQLGVIRLLEGYWPARLDRLRDRLVERRTDWVGPAEERVQVLADGLEDRPPNEQEEFARLDERLRRMPESGRRMPTRLGNILRAAEALPRAKYGLDAPKCWPRLWLVLPDSTRSELNAARAALDAGAATWLWGLLFVIWTVWAWWAAPAGLLVAAGSYVWMVRAATTYADLIESAFDVHRGALYQALRWPLPADAGEELALGEALTLYLWRGPQGHEPLVTPEDRTAATH